MASKYAKLVQRLTERQNDGKLDWKETEVDGRFQLGFPDYAIRIWESEHYDGGSDIVIGIYDAEGGLLDEFTDVSMNNEISNAYQIMNALYAEARRTARGVDKALDVILGELEDL